MVPGFMDAVRRGRHRPSQLRPRRIQYAVAQFRRCTGKAGWPVIRIRKLGPAVHWPWYGFAFRDTRPGMVDDQGRRPVTSLLSPTPGRDVHTLTLSGRFSGRAPSLRRYTAVAQNIRFITVLVARRYDSRIFKLGVLTSEISLQATVQAFNAFPDFGCEQTPWSAIGFVVYHGCTHRAASDALTCAGSSGQGVHCMSAGRGGQDQESGARVLRHWGGGIEAQSCAFSH